MRAIFPWSVLVLGLSLCSTFVAAADLAGLPPPTLPAVKHVDVISSCRAVWRCGAYGCRWRSICPRRCPTPYACYSIYGAYGPYGGTAYWGSFTAGGFVAYR
jgi:hypothetical protein